MKYLKKKLLQNNLLGQVMRFLLTGGGNTLLTMGVYQVFVTFYSAVLSYVLAWVVGLVFVCITYPKFVFQSKNNLKNTVKIIISYVLVFLLGFFSVKYLEQFGIEKRWIIILVTFVTSGLNFILGHFIFHSKKT